MLTRIQQSLTPERRAEILRVAHAAAKSFGCDPEDISGRRTKHSIAEARHATVHAAYRITGCTFEAIGYVLGGRDHSTMTHSVKQVEAWLEIYPRFRARYDEMMTMLGEEVES